MDYKNMKIEDIIEWCQKNDEVAWLKSKAREKKPYKIYPRTIVDGKSVSDKSKEPTTEMRPISFIQLKLDFVEKFMPEIAPEKKPKKPTMYDLIKNL